MDTEWGLGMLLFWGLMVVGVVLLARWRSSEARRNVPPVGGDQEALGIVRWRFARGEITVQEFEAVKRGLK
jgi:putative membrane protein